MIDLCLALVIDWSASIPTQLGRDVIAAHVAGLRDDRVARHAAANGVAVTVILYDDTARIVVPWQPTPAAAADAMEQLDLASPWGSSAAGEGIHAGLAQMDRAPDCERHIIDLAGDGQENTGRAASGARDAAEAAGIQINAVMFQTERGGDDPIQWARDNVRTQGGFVLAATSQAEWLRAIVRKLVMEVASR